MRYKDLRDFIAQLEQQGELKRVAVEVDPRLEMTEVCDRVLKAGGPAILFENPKGFDGAAGRARIPVLANLFGTPRRVALGMGQESVAALREVGKLLAYLKEPDPPKGLKDAWDKLPVLKQVLNMAPKVQDSAPCQEIVWEGKDVDLSRLPIQTCWPGDAGPLITWGLTVTRGPLKARQNLGIYREQVIAPNKVIMRWLAQRGGALDFRDHGLHHPGEAFPVAVALGADPATMLAAVTPVPDSISEYQFAGLLRGAKTELVKCLGSDLQVPAGAEIVLEGVILPGETALEGPFGDHTGFYSLADDYPVFHIQCITHRRRPTYLTTVVGIPPQEDYYLGKASERIFLPVIRKTLPEIVDMHFPAEGIFHNLVIISIDKRYPGHARKIMNACWGLGQLMFSKVIVVVDSDVNVQDVREVAWIVGTHVDPGRDVQFTTGPLDDLENASDLPAYGGKMGIDATRKGPSEGFTRQWPSRIRTTEAAGLRAAQIWQAVQAGRVDR